MTVFQVARDYIARGWAPIPIPRLSKAPVHKKWQDLRITDGKAWRYFNGTVNIGVLTGDPSDHLGDADIDWSEAAVLARSLMPPTGCVFGHGGVAGHLLYRVAGLRYVELTDPETGETILELRGSGHQTLFPGSTHPSGEPIEWLEDTGPASVELGQLVAAARQTAAAALLVRAAPRAGGGRHQFMLDIAGSLIRSLGAEGARRIVAPVGQLIFGAAYSQADEKRLINGTATKLGNGGRVSDTGSLVARLGGRRAGKVIEWLGLRDAQQEHGADLAASILATKAGNGPVPEEGEAGETKPGEPHVAGIAYDHALVLRPGGILQELTDWIAGTCKRQQPILALGGATALVGLLCAHGYRVVRGGHDTRSNIIIVGLAASASGKDHPRRCIKAILAALGMADFVGEDLASGQALEGTFIGHFAHLFLIDEYGHRIAAALSPKGNSSEKKIIEVITKLATSAAGPFTHTRLASNRHVTVPITYDPCLTIFATSVEEPLWNGLSTGQVNDGSVARHLFLRVDTDYPDSIYDTPHFEQRLPEMVANARRVLAGPWGEIRAARRPGELRADYKDDGRGGRERVQPEKPVLLSLPIDAQAKAELERLDAEELELLRAHQSLGTNALVGRLVEHTTRLAQICAVSDNPAAPALAARHVLWGEAVAKLSLTTVLRATSEHVADTPHQADRNKLLRDIRRAAAGGWITRRGVTRCSRSFATRAITPLLAELVELGLIECQTATRGGQAVEEFRCG